jgi:hypothetical protein
MRKTEANARRLIGIGHDPDEIDSPHAGVFQSAIASTSTAEVAEQKDCKSEIRSLPVSQKSPIETCG